MSILGRFFKSDVDVPTRNSEIINAVKILHNSALSDNERVGALSKLKSIFLASNDKDDLRAISQSILKTAKNDESVKVREIALKTFDTIIGSAAQHKLSVVAENAMPILMEIAEYRNEDAKELRLMGFWVLSKIAPFAISDAQLDFLARNLNDKDDNVKTAVSCAFENLVKASDDSLKRRVVRFALPALCEALDNSSVTVRATRALGGLGKFALGAAPFLYKRLDQEGGEWAGNALRSITGEPYGDKEKDKWEKWLQKSIVE